MRQCNRWSAGVIGAVLTVLGLAGPAPATDYIWTNIANGAVGYWTNGILWGQADAASYPQTLADRALFTSNTAINASYTVILDTNVAVSEVRFSNASGVPRTTRLIVTNGVTLTVTNLLATSSAGSRVSIQLDGAILSSNEINVGSAFVNCSNTLVAAAAGATWNLNRGNLKIAAPNAVSSYNDVLVLDGANLPGGLLVTNVGGVYVGQPIGGNSFSVSNNTLRLVNGARLYSAGDAYVSAGTPLAGNTRRNDNKVEVNGANSLWNLGGKNLFIGNETLPVTNALVRVLNGGTLCNGQLILNSTAAWTPLNGLDFDAGSTVNMGITVGFGISSGGGASNVVVVLDTTVTTRTLTNQLVLPPGVTHWDAGGGNLIVGGTSSCSNNTLRIVNGVWTNFARMTAGGGSTTSNNVLALDGTACVAAMSVLAYSNNTLGLLGGRLQVLGSLTNNAAGPWVIGDGQQRAVLELNTGTASNRVAGGLLLTNNAFLAGSGVLATNLTIAAGGGIECTVSGGVPALLTVVGAITANGTPALGFALPAGGTLTPGMYTNLTCTVGSVPAAWSVTPPSGYSVTTTPQANRLILNIRAAPSGSVVAVR